MVPFMNKPQFIDMLASGFDDKENEGLELEEEIEIKVSENSDSEGSSGNDNVTDNSTNLPPSQPQSQLH